MKFYSFLFLAVVNFQLFSQDTIYSKLYNGLEGKSQVKQDLKIEDHKGSFDFFQLKELDKTFTLQSYNGFLESGKKEKFWEYQYQEYTPSNSTSLKDNILQTTINGFKMVFSGSFKNNLAQDKWVIKKLEINNSDENLVNQIIAEFDNGKFINQIEQKSSDFNFKGQFDNESQPDGKWIMSYINEEKAYEEHYVFNKGQLIEHQFLGDFSNKQIEFKQQNDTANFVIVDFNFEHLTVQSHQLLKDKDLQNFDEFIKNTEFSKKQLSKYFADFSKQQNLFIWHVGNYDSSFFAPKIKLKYYAHSDEFKVKLNKIIESSEEVTQKISQLLNKESFIIHQNTDSEIALYMRVFQEYQKWFNKNKTFFELFKSNLIDYYDENSLMPNQLVAAEFPNQIDLNIRDEIITKNHQFPKPQQSKTINSLQSIIQFINDDVNKIIKKSEIIIANNIQMTELEEKEKILISSKDEVLAYLQDEVEKSDGKVEIKYFDFLDQLVNQTYQSYTYLELDEKKKQIEQTILCIESIPTNITKIQNIFNRHQKLINLYTRTTWNAFTMTDMSEIIKPRLFVAYTKLYENIVKNIINSNTCESFDNLMRDYNKTYLKMIDLHEEDTKTIELALRRVNNLNEIKSIILPN